MKTPICSFDAKTGVLCSNCESKLRSGGITQDDVEASIKLTRLAEKDQEINKFTLVRGAKVESEYILVLRGSDVTTARGNPAIVNKIERDFQNKVWLVEAEASERRLLENLFYPAKITTVNQFWLPDGNKLTKVIIQGSKAKNTQINIEKVQKVAKAAKNIELLTEFETK